MMWIKQEKEEMDWRYKKQSYAKETTISLCVRLSVPLYRPRRSGRTATDSTLQGKTLEEMYIGLVRISYFEARL